VTPFALKLSTDENPPSTMGGRWYWLDEAAGLLGVNVGTIRRRCLEDWQHKGLATKARRDNGQEAWKIHAAVDPRLTAPATDNAPANQVDLSKLNDDQRAEFSRRLRLLDEWQAALKGGLAIGLVELEVTTRFIARQKSQGVAISRGTLFRWRQRRDDQGPKGLIDERWITADNRPLDDRFAEVLKRAYLDQRKRSKQLCWEMAVEAAFADAPSEAPSYTTAKRIIASIPKATVQLLRYGERDYKNKVEYYADGDYSTMVSNETWVSDHHRFNVQVQYVDQRTGELKHDRPWLHAWQDMRSRKIVGYSIFMGDANAQIIARTFLGAVRTCYAPGKVYLDNGKDFDSRVLQGITKKQRRKVGGKVDLTDAEKKRLGGVFSVLDIAVQHTWTYHGQSKPIERWFGTVDARFSKRYDTYCGKDTADKPDDLNRKVESGQAPMLADFIAAFDQYVADDHNARKHLGDSMHGKCPDQVWAECLTARRAIPEELLRFAGMVRVEVTVRQNAIVALPGYEITFGHSERQLVDRIGQKVQIAYSPEETLGEVLLLEADGTPICPIKARDKVARNATPATLKPHIREKKGLRKTQRDYHAARPKLAMDVPELAAAAAAKRAIEQREQMKATGTDQLVAAAPMEPIRTPFDLASIRLAGGGPAITIRHEASDADAPLPSIFTYQRRVTEDEQ
jgi:putative transposase